MTIDIFREYCLAKSAVTEDYPFDGSCAWFKVAGKMFALINVSEMKMGKDIVPPCHFANLKCDPERAIELREEYEQIQPGWHMGKKHWNSIYFDKSIKDSFVKQLIDDSYNLVVAGLSKKEKELLQNS